jgi:hypothetical protein
LYPRLLQVGGLKSWCCIDVLVLHRCLGVASIIWWTFVDSSFSTGPFFPWHDCTRIDRSTLWLTSSECDGKLLSIHQLPWTCR